MELEMKIECTKNKTEKASAECEILKQKAKNILQH